MESVPTDGDPELVRYELSFTLTDADLETVHALFHEAAATMATEIEETGHYRLVTVPIQQSHLLGMLMRLPDTVTVTLIQRMPASVS